MLQMAGHEVEEAANGQLGLELYSQNPADLVITDIRMPIKDGLETIEELRRDYPNVKIIAMAAYGEAALSRTRELGVNRAVEKPFRLKDLKEMVEELLGE